MGFLKAFLCFWQKNCITYVFGNFENCSTPTSFMVTSKNPGFGYMTDPSLIAVYYVFRSTVFWMYSQAYGPHPLLRAASPYVPNYYGGYPPPATAGPPTTGPATGGYTLPPTAAYFPITAYTNNTNTNNSNTQPNTASVDNTQQVMMSQDSLNQQPNTPDLLMHRRTVSCSWKNLLYKYISNN